MHGARAVWSLWCGEQGPVVWAGVTFERGGKNWFLLSAGRGLALTRPTRDIPSNVIRPRSELSSCALAQVGSIHGQKRKNLHFALPSASADELSSGWALFGACALPMSLVSASPPLSSSDPGPAKRLPIWRRCRADSCRSKGRSEAA